MHKIVKSTAYPVGAKRAGTPIRDKIECSKLEDFPTNPSSQHPCPSPPTTVFCPWSHPVESRSVAVHFCLLPFLSLQLRVLKRQSPSPCLAWLFVCTVHPLQAHPATPTSHQSTFESHRLKDALVSQTPQKLVSQRWDILPPCPSRSRALQHCRLVPVAFCSSVSP